MNFYEYLENSAKDNGVDKLVIGAVITNENGEVLLMKRKQDDFMGGIFEIPGGNAEEGESIYDILKREIKEETNLEKEYSNDAIRALAEFQERFFESIIINEK